MRAGLRTRLSWGEGGSLLSLQGGVVGAAASAVGTTSGQQWTLGGEGKELPHFVQKVWLLGEQSGGFSVAH